MAWTDDPTDMQLERLSYWLGRVLEWQKREPALLYLKAHATRKEVSDEMTRVKKLYDEYKLDEDTCFDSSIWTEYKAQA